MSSLDGKVAVVTGGGSGIGEAACIRLHEDGARVAVLDLNVDAARVTAQLSGGGPAVRVDVADPLSVDAALRQVEGELGPVDVWVNNAGIGGGPNHDRVNPRFEAQISELTDIGKVVTPVDGLLRLPDEEWRAMISVHLDGTFYGTRAAARSMAARGQGSIINIASICGLEGCTGHPHYSAAKGGILAFTRSVAKELIQQGVRVNVVAPGFIDTAMISALTDAQKRGVVTATPAGRLGRPQEIAAAISYLAGDDASFVVGETISVNGGLATL